MRRKTIGMNSVNVREAAMLKAMQVFLGMLVFAGLLAGCQSMSGQTTGEYIDDAGLTAAVKARLANNQVSSMGRVGVETVDGVVYLTGVVRSGPDRAEAARLARQVDGVKRVNNNLTVQAE
jgi:hyperosmotically inducible periplasmic protein